MAKELLEDEVLKPMSISVNPKTMQRFDEIVGRDMRSKVIRKLIENYIEAGGHEMAQTPNETLKEK